MRRGTTPTFVFDVDADLSGWDVYVSFGRAGKATHTEKPAAVEPADGGCRVSVSLTQAETLSMKAGPAQAQIRAVKDGVAVATGIWDFDVEPVLLDGEIPKGA